MHVTKYPHATLTTRARHANKKINQDAILHKKVNHMNTVTWDPKDIFLRSSVFCHTHTHAHACAGSCLASSGPTDRYAARHPALSFTKPSLRAYSSASRKCVPTHMPMHVCPAPDVHSSCNNSSRYTMHHDSHMSVKEFGRHTNLMQDAAAPPTCDALAPSTISKRSFRRQQTTRGAVLCTYDCT